jgi:peptide chain release factor 1
MKASILHKLDHLTERFDEISGLLSQAEIQHDQNKFRALSQEYAQLEPIVVGYNAYQQNQHALDDTKEMMQEADAELRELAQVEFKQLELEKHSLQHQLHCLLLPQDPNDNRNIYLEIRAGTGGDEAAIFSGDLSKMYQRYVEKQGWETELISENRGDHGGFKEIVLRISGKEVYSQFKFESGTHRVQRIPETESQGRVHTSACTVAVMPAVDAVDEIEINSGDLRVDTFRASGSGGQHVNKTDSAIRLTHLPTGVVVECQDERSQHKNRARAMALLQSRLLAAEQEKHNAEQAQKRKLQVGTGDRSEKIRTYNYPQGRISDHRINLTLYKLDDIMQGALAQVITPLINEHQAELLTQLGDEN